MIHLRAIGYVLGQFLVVFAATMLAPLLYGYLTDGLQLEALYYPLLITAACGGALVLRSPRPERELTQREGLLLAVAIWMAVAMFGSLPFIFSPGFPTVTDAVFESVSGFTTTGATVLKDVEILSTGVQFWRCLSHWLGGLGILLLVIAVLPLIGHGGMRLYRAEFSGATSEKLKPRITETALALWRIYFALTAVTYLSLRLAGMNNFDALCHSLSAVGTGGFSTRTASIAAFESPLIEYILIVAMALGGVSFIQQYRLWMEWRPAGVLRDIEIRYYLLLILVATAIIAAVLIGQQGYALEPGLRAALFQVVAITTTTGFASDNFEVWLPLPQLLLLALMFVGGCTGSTAGGLKVSRILLLARVVDREFKRMVERRGVFAVRLGGEVIPETTVQSLLNLIYLAFVVNFFSCLALAGLGVDVLTSISAVAGTMFNVGPGLGSVGPAESYGHLPALAKWVLCFDMIAGRLEFYTVIVILTPAFWRK